MNKSYKNECELKTKLKTDIEKEQFIARAINLGFKKQNDCLQTDYTVDTLDNACKENGLILRFRSINPTYEIDSRQEQQISYIITLKVKQESTFVQNNIEYECLSTDKQGEIFSLINQYLINYTNCDISSIDFNVPLQELVKELYSIGFNRCRMLSQKIRLEYCRDKLALCFDCFPKPIGKYMEIEAQTPEALYDIIKELQTNPDRFGKLNYGKLIQASLAKAGVPTQYCRVCLFDSILRKELLQILY